ncbi:choice-of-anchor I family protein [Pedobacter sp. Hv1]|uniref:choice-of-anchor I family protein n=1 Tax=Pedobacter sp. Hv1 TaxID=1740090 RepID=UPI0006D8C0A6|nr:choice-of-anchor I family protein [Pedobacter sp. Hv1]KQB99931.1 alkaline phosphatase [Pedobacter sp. Hv1]
MTVKTKLLTGLVIFSLALSACKKNTQIEPEVEIKEDVATFKQAAMIDLGGVAAAEISAYDPLTKKLFVVNNETTSRVDVIDLSNFPTVTKVKSIEFAGQGWANSVAVSNGLLAVAVEAAVKQDNGSIYVFKTSTYEEVKKVTVGALPDMVTFSPDGNYIMSANEGEPNASYTVDPVGSISIIDVKNNYAVKTLNFAGFEGNQTTLMAGGFRIFGGPEGSKSSFAQDIEPEYITISADSKKAYVTLQENNGVAEVDIVAGVITKVMPLGTRDISLAENAFDVTEDGKYEAKTWPLKAYYLPDAISHFTVNGTGYFALANEGDTREYDGYKEETTVKKVKLDPVKFPNAATLQLDANMGKLVITEASGKNKDGFYEELYAVGGRSMSIHNAATGAVVAHIGKDLEQHVAADLNNKYDDKRSPKKGVEVESVTVAEINGKTIAFIGMERADAIAVYDISIPNAPKFIQVFETGDAPEGLLFVKAKDSPNGRSLLIVASEEDGTMRFYQPNKL